MSGCICGWFPGESSFTAGERMYEVVKVRATIFLYSAFHFRLDLGMSSFLFYFIIFLKVSLAERY